MRAGAGAFIIYPVTFADAYLAEVGSGMDAWDCEHARALMDSFENVPADVRQAWALREASDLVVPLAIRLAVHGEPGADVGQDVDWAAAAAFARRRVLAYQAAGLDSGMADRNLCLIDRICSLIGSWPEADWTRAIGCCVEEIVRARHRGRERGEQLRQADRLEEQPGMPPVGWLLRHPADHYFRRARAKITDSRLCAHIDGRIADLDPGYAAMADQDWRAEEREADLVVELEVLDVAPGWTEAVRAVVVATHRGGASTGSELPIGLVADPAAQFNGMLISLIRGERWLTCASLLKDGTALPGDGTRRLKAPPG